MMTKRFKTFFGVNYMKMSFNSAGFDWDDNDNGDDSNNDDDE